MRMKWRKSSLSLLTNSVFYFFPNFPFFINQPNHLLILIVNLVDEEMKEYETRGETLSIKSSQNHQQSPIDPSFNPSTNQHVISNQLKSKHVTMPVFYGGKHKIWGLTAILTETFLQFVIMPALKNKL